jgi:hypothetical protein
METGPPTGPAGAQRIYFACFTDPAGPDSGPLIKENFAAHKAWVLAHESDLLLAGPLLDESFSSTGCGLIVMRANSISHATRMAAEDPMHSSGARTFRIVPWQINEGSITVSTIISRGWRDFE